MCNSPFESSIVEGVLQVSRPDTAWLSTGWQGGHHQDGAAYNISVPEGWHCADLEAYVHERLERAAIDPTTAGPVLLTGVDLEHARGAHCGPVTVYATAGISNPAALPMDPAGGPLPPQSLERDGVAYTPAQTDSEHSPGTVNLIVGTTRQLASGALANLLTVAAEAKAATLLAKTGFPGTTTDALVVGHCLTGSPTAFSGSATPVGAATRAAVREAITASLASRYDTIDYPASVADASYGVSTDVRATVFEPIR